MSIMNGKIRGGRQMKYLHMEIPIDMKDSIRKLSVLGLEETRYIKLMSIGKPRSSFSDTFNSESNV